MNEKQWEIFTATGRISDYLAYRGIIAAESGDTNGNGYPQGDSSQGVSRG